MTEANYVGLVFSFRRAKVEIITFTDPGKTSLSLIFSKEHPRAKESMILRILYPERNSAFPNFVPVPKKKHCHV